MHGLATEDLLRLRTKELEDEFGVKTAISTADMTKPAEIRCAGIGSMCDDLRYCRYFLIW